MDNQQLKNRELFIKKLITAGWDPKGWEVLFEGGTCLTPEAQAEHRNSSFDLRLSYYIEQSYVLLECEGRYDTTILSFRFYPKENLDTILERITMVQDTLSPDNYTDFIETIIPLADIVLLETSEGLVQLSK